MLIGISGAISAGKGTVGDILKTKGFTKVAFADSVKDVCSMIYGWPRELMEGDSEVSRDWREKPDPYWSSVFGYPYTPRMAMNHVGTISIRNTLHKDFWIHSLILRRRTLSQTVITDVRHQNEIKFIREHNGILLQVTRGEDPPWVKELSKIAVDDPIRESVKMAVSMEYGIPESELDWIGTEFHYTIRNDGELSDLIHQVDELLEKFKNKKSIAIKLSEEQHEAIKRNH